MLLPEEEFRLENLSKSLPPVSFLKQIIRKSLFTFFKLCREARFKSISGRI